MNAAQAACAPSGDAPQWRQIDWRHCARDVRRLQARIVKAGRAARAGRTPCNGCSPTPSPAEPWP